MMQNFMTPRYVIFVTKYLENDIFRLLIQFREIPVRDYRAIVQTRQPKG